MTSRDFCFWLQGYLEITGAGGVGGTMSDQQVACIQRHLGLVFTHEIDPSMKTPEPKTAHETTLDEKHRPQFGGTDAHGNVYRC